MHLAVAIVLLATLAPLAANECGGEFTAERGTIKSPKYPKKYPKNSDCKWNILAAPGSRIMFKCTKKKFKIKASKGCVNDYLQVNGIYYCGKAVPIEIYSDAPMKLHFHSDRSGNSKGFICNFIRVTGGPYVSTTVAPTPIPTTVPPPITVPTTAKPETSPPTPAPTTIKPVTPPPTTAKPVTPPPTTVKPTTPPQTTVKPMTPAPTGPPTTNCDSIVVKNNDWNEGWSGYMLLSPSGDVNGWKATITFDSHVNTFEVYTAYMDSPTSGTFFTIKNKEWNAIPESIPMKIDFLYRFNSGVPLPKIISISFNDENLCGGGPVPTSGPGPTNGPVSTNGPVTTAEPAITGPICEGGKYDYYEVLHKSLLFYEAQRSGPLPASNRVPWRKDSALADAKDADTDTQIDLTGGYYDAGDHVKFGFPMAASITVLAWGAIAYKTAYEQAGEMNYMKEAVKWGTDYFIKAHPEANVFYGQVGDGHVDHASWGRPEDMTMKRPAYKITTAKPGSDLAGETAAALAAASILFKDSDPAYSGECLQHARELYDFADKYPGKYSDSITDAASFYRSWSGYGDELAWSAAWMYYATKENTYLTAAESHYNSLTAAVVEFSWDDKTAGARALLAQLTGKKEYISAIQEFCDLYISKQRTPKGLTWHSQWGPLRYTANAAFLCLRAADIGIKTTEYYDYAMSQIHYMLGDTGRSFVVGYGVNPPKRPHHRAASCPAKPATCNWAQYHTTAPNPNVLVGALVGGPAQDDGYEDDRMDYISNEVTTDYNAAFQGAVAALANVCGNRTITTSGPGTVTTMKPIVTIKPTIAPTTTQDPGVTPGPGCLGDGKYNYDEVLNLSLLFYEAQRSGPLPSNNRVVWRGDSALDDAKDKDSKKKIDLTGGYYDAGDHVKFGFPMAATVTVLAWGAIAYKDAYTAAGQMSYMKAAVKWGTDYFIKAHTAKNVLYGQVGDGNADHSWWGRPEDMTMDRPAFKITKAKPGSELAGETAAALAAASILFDDSNPTYAAECLRHAEELYNFADTYKGKYSDSIPEANPFYTNWGGYNDELTWAAAWLYYATNNNDYLVKAESQSNSLGNPQEFSWDDKTAGARVLLAQLTGESKYKSASQQFCDNFMSKQRSPKGLTWHSKWGNLRYVSNAVFVCLRAADLGIKTTEYYNYGRSQIHYMLGDAGRSYVVGYGVNPPQKPHHRSSSCPDQPDSCGWDEYNSPNPNPQILYGALVGGPDSNDFYEDKRDDYIKNEVTTDYNAGFQGAVAALRKDTCLSTEE